MQKKSVVRVGCLRIIDHFIALVTRNRLNGKTGDISMKSMDLSFFRSFEQIRDSFLQDEIDSAFIPLALAMDLFRAGLKIKVLMFVNRGGGMLLKGRETGIKTIKDFKGRVILTPYTISVQNMLLHRLFQSAGLRLGWLRDKGADVFLEFFPSDIIEEVVNHGLRGGAGGFIAVEPFGIRAARQGKAVSVCRFDSLWQNYPGDVFAVRESVVKAGPGKMGYLVNGFIESADMIYSGNSDEIMAWAREFSGLDREIVTELLAQTGHMFKPAMLFPDISPVETVQDYMVDTAGFMEGKIDADQLIDTGFVQNLRRQ